METLREVVGDKSGVCWAAERIRRAPSGHCWIADQTRRASCGGGGTKFLSKLIGYPLEVISSCDGVHGVRQEKKKGGYWCWSSSWVGVKNREEWREEKRSGNKRVTSKGTKRGRRIDQ
jgi:hypothetical protein